MTASSLALKLLREFPEEIQEYFKKLDKKCQKRRIILRLSSGLCVNANGGRCSGYFDYQKKELAVALGSGWEHSFKIALHEEQHYKQQFDPKSICHTKINDNHAKFFQWLAGKNFKNPRILAMSAMAIERDCERRTVAEIRKKYSHLINPESYSVQANAYLASYYWQMKHRSWLKKTPYNRKLMAHCPPKLFRSFADIPENLELAMERFL